MPDVAFLTLAADHDQPRKRIQVAQLGRFKDPRYGTFSITAQDVESWKRLLAEHFQGEVPIDLDHATDKGGPSEAMAWIKSLELQGDKVMADVEWTDKGEDAVRSKRYRYISPTFVANLKDKTDKNLGPALLRAALTNNPFLRDMPAVSLAGPVFATVTDTPRVMSTLAPIALALGLDKDATEAQVLLAVEQAKNKPSPTVTLDQAAQVAESEGKVLLDKTEADQLKTDAAKAGALEQRVTTLEAQARDEKFSLAYEKAMSDGRVDAKPETRERFQKLFALDADTTLATLDALPKIVNLAAGTQSARDHAEGEAPAGHDPESYELNRKVEAYLLEHPDLDYVTALNRVQAQES